MNLSYCNFNLLHEKKLNNIMLFVIVGAIYYKVFKLNKFCLNRLQIICLLLTIIFLPSPVLAVKLFTNRLILRPISLADTDRVYNLLQNPKIADNTCAMPYPYLKENAVEWIKSLEIPNKIKKQIVFGITLRSIDELIGVIAFDIEDSINECSIGYWLGKDYWGKGYATETLAKMIEYGFTELKLTSVSATHFSGNIQSGKVMKKCGMKYVGENVKYIPVRKRKENLVSYKITQGDFLKLGGAWCHCSMLSIELFDDNGSPLHASDFAITPVDYMWRGKNMSKEECINKCCNEVKSLYWAWGSVRKKKRLFRGICSHDEKITDTTKFNVSGSTNPCFD